jgi:diguanylate cyclase (GGDEF)-like protein/PAS domain S-box-containing protein
MAKADALTRVQDLSVGDKDQLAENKYAGIVASAMDAIIAVDGQQRITVFNAAAEKMFLCSAPQAIGKPISTLIPSRFLQVQSADAQYFRRNGSSNCAQNKMRSLSGLRANGEEFPMEASISQLRTNDEQIFTVIVRDVTERMRAEENNERLTTELQAANQTLREQIIQRETAEAALLTAHQELRLRSDEMERSASLKRRLAEMGEFLQSCVTSAEARQIAEHSLQALFPHAGGIVYLNRDFDNLVESFASWNTTGLASKETLEHHECWGLRRGRPHLVRSSDPTTKCAHVHELPEGCSICVPMVAQGQPLGLFHLAWTGNGDAPSACYLEHQEDIAVSAAETLAFAIANVKLREKLKEQTIRDPLTQLYNRRHLEDALYREMSRASRTNTPVGLIMIDVDNFKLFNDSFGHLVGDKLLRTLGAYLKSHVRPEDVPARYGGEEFALILPGASRGIVTVRAEALRKGFRDIPLELGGIEGISISCGVAIFPEHGNTVEELFHAADAALYGAKKNGKNCVMVSADRLRLG